MSFDSSPTKAAKKSTKIPKQIRIEDTKPVFFRDFTIMELLGEGSFGKVFRVQKKDTGKQYAMKSMKK